MKNLILIIVLLAPFSLFAQNKVEARSTTVNDQTDFWMNKISSDSEMRVKMMDMMVNKTSGSKEEMMKLVNSVLNNPEMNKMIFAVNNVKTENEDISLKPRGTMSDSVKVKEMMKVKTVPKK